MNRREFLKWCVRACAVAVAADGFWWEKRFIEYTPLAFGRGERTTLKLIQLSDLHINALTPALREAAWRVNQLAPDMIFITGDAIDHKERLGLLNAFLRLLNPAIPKVATLGNWEYWCDVSLRALDDLYMEHNIVLLVNGSRRYEIRGATVWVTGLDSSVGGEADFDRATAHYVPSDFHVVLNHCPGYRDMILQKVRQDLPVDLILSGHTHGGQINLFGFVPLVPPGSGAYMRGWYTDGGAPMYVSRGIGTSGVPVRLGSRAEIPVLTVRV